MRTKLSCYFIRILLLTVILALQLYSQVYSWRLKFSNPNTFTVAINPRNPHSVYAYGNDTHLYVSYNDGITWNQRGVASTADVRQIIVHPADTMVIFVVGASSFGGGLRRSTDYGMTWNVVLPNFQIDGESIAYDPLRPDTMVAGNFSDGRIYRTTNRGATWSMMGSAGNRLCALAIRPDTTSILYGGSDAGKISKSTDSGATWRIVKTTGSYEVPKIVINPVNPLIAYATALDGPDTGTGVWKTTDGGEMWARTSLRGISVWALDISQTNPNVVYTGTFPDGHDAVYRTMDGGNSWDTLKAGFPTNGEAWSLKVDPLDFTNVWLAINNFAQPGIYHWESVLGVDEIDNPRVFRLRQNYPNPFNPLTTIRFTIHLSFFVSLKVYNIIGKEIATLVNDEKESGEHSVTFDASNLASGVYFYRLSSGSLVESKKMLLIR